MKAWESGEATGENESGLSGVKLVARLAGGFLGAGVEPLSPLSDWSSSVNPPELIG